MLQLIQTATQAAVPDITTRVMVLMGLSFVLGIFGVLLGLKLRELEGRRKRRQEEEN